MVACTVRERRNARLSAVRLSRPERSFRRRRPESNRLVRPSASLETESEGSPRADTAIEGGRGSMDAADLQEKERQRAAPTAEASRIVQAAKAQSRALTPEEDAHVLRLMKGVRTLEEQIGRGQRHQTEPASQHAGHKS